MSNEQALNGPSQAEIEKTVTRKINEFKKKKETYYSSHSRAEKYERDVDTMNSLATRFYIEGENIREYVFWRILVGDTIAGINLLTTKLDTDNGDIEKLLDEMLAAK